MCESPSRPTEDVLDKIDHAADQHNPLVVGVACIRIAMTTPILEFVPFSVNLAGASIAAFAVALLAKDGLLASLAIGLSLATLGIVAMQLLGS